MVTIDEKLGFDALFNGFVEIFNAEAMESIRPNLESLVVIGKTNGAAFYHRAGMTEQSTNVLYLDFSTDEEKKASIEEIMKFFTQQEFEEYLLDKTYKSVHQYEYIKGIGKDGLEIMKALENINIKAVTPKPFHYFKQFRAFAYANSKSCTLFNESGFGLHHFSKSNLTYEKQERETYYTVEAVTYKFHQLGLYIARQELRDAMVAKIKATIPFQTKENTRYSVICDILKTYLERHVCIHSEVDEVLLDIQTVVGPNEFMTAKQVSKALNAFANSNRGKAKLKELKELFTKK